MFPTQLSNEFSFRSPANPQGYQIQDDGHIMNNDSFENNLFNFSIGSSDKQVRKGKRKQTQIKEDSSSKKAMHREVEKKRRLEMSNLHASLNSLLPDDHLKGKRSVCDQIQEAAAHIKRMEKRIEESKSRRDKLKSSISGGDNRRDYVTINMGSDGMEILISHGIRTNELGLAPVLTQLHRNQLDVISTTSSRVNERFIHKIYVEARDKINLDVFALQDQLSKAIK